MNAWPRTVNSTVSSSPSFADGLSDGGGVGFPDVAVGEHARVELGRLAGLAVVEPQAGDDRTVSHFCSSPCSVSHEEEIPARTCFMHSPPERSAAWAARRFVPSARFRYRVDGWGAPGATGVSMNWRARPWISSRS